MLGNGESSSPSNSTSFPTSTLRYQDNINAQYTLLTQHLHIKTLDAVIGFSMGGQQAYYWAVMHGSGPTPFVKSIVAICATAKTSPHNYAFLEGPIGALENSVDYADGAYREKGVKPIRGLRAFGRAWAAWLTSPEWFRRELWRNWGAKSLQAYLYPDDGQGPWDDWDAANLLVMARCWQAGDVGDVGGSGAWKEALREVEARVLVIPCDTDQYFRLEDCEEEVKYLRNGRLEIIRSIWGHAAGGDANAADAKWVDERINEFLKSI